MVGRLCLRPVAHNGATSAGLTAPRLLHCSSLESELRPLPLNPGQRAVQMHKDLYIAGALGSIHAHIFTHVECFVLTSLEEVRQILEPRK